MPMRAKEFGENGAVETTIKIRSSRPTSEDTVVPRGQSESLLLSIERKSALVIYSLFKDFDRESSI